MNTGTWDMIFLGTMFVGIGMVLFLLVDVVQMEWTNTVEINQDVLDDVCQQLTNNSVAVSVIEYGKLVCELPSFDSTQNIIVRGNDEE